MKSYIEKANKYTSLNKNIDYFKPTFHFAPKIGWANDPNGFSMFNGKYHLFYQSHPYSTKWGPMHWGHAESKDLIKWSHLPYALAPQSDGVDGGTTFSGSAIVENNKHILMYTENWHNRQVQSIATSEDGINYIPYQNNPVIDVDNVPPNSNINEFRDPKIFKKGDLYYCVIGSKTNDDKGQVVLYKSENLYDWKFVNVIVNSKKIKASMYECPDLFELDNKDVLVMSPQHVKTVGNEFNNLHSSTYMIGKLDYKTGDYKCDTVKEIDHGLDFYAPQTMIDDKGRTIMIAWMGMWERTFPTHDLNHNWAGLMTLPRMLNIVDNKIHQTPIEEINKYKNNYEKFVDKISGNKLMDFTAETAHIRLLLSDINAKEVGIKVFKGLAEETIIYYDKIRGEVIFDRKNSGIKISGNSEHEHSSNVRSVPIGHNTQIKLDIFLDKSTVEIFINDGAETMSSVVYPQNTSNKIELFTNQGDVSIKVEKWDITV